jgi:hypothetical protein
LEILDWQKTLSSGMHFMALGVRPTPKGTFQDLITATHNELVVHARDIASTGSIHLAKDMEVGKRSDGVITLGDLLARTNELRNIYEQCTYKASKAIPCSASSISGHINIQLTISTPSDVDALRQLLRIPKGANVQTALFTPGGNDPNSVSLGFTADDNDPNSYLPHLERASYLLEPWENGGYLSPLLRYFVISYILGMLVRYYPSKWMYLFSYQKGDTLLPLLRATISNIESAFPKEAARMVEP